VNRLRSTLEEVSRNAPRLYKSRLGRVVKNHNPVVFEPLESD